MNKVIAVLISAFALQACTQGLVLGYRFPEGDPNRGLEAFETLRCRGCHRIDGLDPPFEGTGAASVTLGGQTARVKTYGDLVTSIVNPSHKILRGYAADEVATQEGESIMSLADLNDVVTVQQLIDLVAFLQVEYNVVPPPIRINWDEYLSPRLDEEP